MINLDPKLKFCDELLVFAQKLDMRLLKLKPTFKIEIFVLTFFNRIIVAIFNVDFFVGFRGSEISIDEIVA